MSIYCDLLRNTSGLGLQLEYPAYAIFTTVIKEFFHTLLVTNGFINANLVHDERN